MRTHIEMRSWAFLDWITGESPEVWGNWILHLDKVTTMTLLFVTITNNLFMRVLPGGKLFFYGCPREAPAAILQEKRTAGLQFVFLRGREGGCEAPGTGIPVLSGVTCSVREEGRGHSTNSCCRKNYQLIKDGGQNGSRNTENIQLVYYNINKWCRRCTGQADS